jgi:hypothetical protein
MYGAVYLNPEYDTFCPGIKSLDTPTVGRGRITWYTKRISHYSTYPLQTDNALLAKVRVCITDFWIQDQFFPKMVRFGRD